MAPPLEFPILGFNCPDHYGEGTACDSYNVRDFDPDNIPTYNIDALPRRTRADDGRRQPVYHDHSQLFGIGVHDWDEHRRIFVGLDRVGESLAVLPGAGSRGGVQIRHGSLADGVDRADFQAYLTQALELETARYETAPTVNIAGNPTADQLNWIVAAIELVNAALPPASRMRVATPGLGTLAEIEIEFRPYTEFRDGVGGTTWNTIRTEANGDKRILNSLIHIDADAFARGSHRHFVTLIAHEFGHALGLDHVSESFATIMESSRQVYRAWQGFQVSTRIDPDYSCGFANCFTPIHENLADIPMPMSLLYPLDVEALHVLYARLGNGTAPTDYGYWASSSLHVAGNGPHANFGVALRNDLAQPWAHGYLPVGDLARNPALSGRVTWTGAVLGFTPAAQPVAGDASISVNLAPLTGTASFSDLEAWAANGAPGAAGTGTTWLDGDLRYAIAVRGNTFRETGGDAGTLTGIFTGAAHEGAAGTLERFDLTAAFGASRQ